MKKKALYQMAMTIKPEEPSTAQPSAVLTTVAASVPDGRLANKLLRSPSMDNGNVSSGDRIVVSQRLHNPELEQKLAVRKSDVRQALGYGTLGLLANAYLEQSQMTAEEISLVQQSFYGVGNP